TIDHLEPQIHKRSRKDTVLIVDTTWYPPETTPSPSNRGTTSTPPTTRSASTSSTRRQLTAPRRPQRWQDAGTIRRKSRRRLIARVYERRLPSPFDETPLRRNPLSCRIRSTRCANC